MSLLVARRIAGAPVPVDTSWHLYMIIGLTRMELPSEGIRKSRECSTEREIEGKTQSVHRIKTGSSLMPRPKALEQTGEMKVRQFVA